MNNNNATYTERAKAVLEAIKPRMTTTVNGHVVTRWSADFYEVDSLGREWISLTEALELVTL
jgi:hypothetical protein